MKKELGVLIVMLIAPWMISATEVTVIIDNFESDEGHLTFAVYTDSEMYLKKGIDSDCKVGLIENKQTTVICQLKPGEYSMAFYHDENENGEMDKNWVGIPKESMGMSNNAKGFMGPPHYEDTVFQVGDEALEMKIHLMKM